MIIINNYYNYNYNVYNYNNIIYNKVFHCALIHLEICSPRRRDFLHILNPFQLILVI